MLVTLLLVADTISESTPTSFSHSLKKFIVPIDVSESVRA